MNFEIGIRVYVAYDPEARESGLGCSTGTIRHGPFAPGTVFKASDDQEFYLLEDSPSWVVDIDGEGAVVVSERLLTTM